LRRVDMDSRVMASENFIEPHLALMDPDTYIGSSPLSMVRQFARTFGQPLDKEWRRDSRLDLLRLLLVKEEANEVYSSDGAENLVKELADLVYVSFGYAATFGWDLDEALRRVHASNMSKLGDDGKPIYREDGKVLKGDNYQPPSLKDLVE
jgi:NTP pyrophosphatase (non-canonical NTP hydrolase)